MMCSATVSEQFGAHFCLTSYCFAVDSRAIYDNYGEYGLKEGVITPEGSFMYCMESYYVGINVTNSVVINDDEMLLSIQKKNANKLVIFNLETKEEKVVIKPENGVYILDIQKVPFSDSEHAFFMMHTGKGIELVNVAKNKTYLLAQNAQTNFNVCKSIDIRAIEEEDVDQGFWLVQIDNGLSMQ